jgi:uncharacterized protein (DUF2252 family)
MTAVQRIVEYNRGREPERLAMKLRAIRADPFVFLRGTCHLFYERLPRDSLLRNAPAAWLCGDLHLQNMGSYKGDNRLVYYDINDFDEAALGPCTWDLLRLLASILVGAKTLKVSPREALGLCRGFMDSYAATVTEGKARWVETATAKGMIKELLDGLAGRKRKDLLDARSDLKGKSRRLRLDGRRALPASDLQRERIASFMQAFAVRQREPRFFKLLDMARRIAGTGSLGLERYVLLVEGKGSPDGNYLLDLKQALPSSLAPHLPARQPRWTSEAERVVQVQQRMQAVSQAFLQCVTVAAMPFVLRGLQPSEDRVDLAHWHGKLHRLQHAVADMGQVLAWDQLRSSGRQGSASADELIEFATRAALRKGMVDLAVQCASRVEADWNAYRDSDLGRS